MSNKEQILRRIVDNQQYEEIDGVIIDLYSASAILAVLDAINETNKAKYLTKPIHVMADIAFKLLNKVGA